MLVIMEVAQCMFIIKNFKMTADFKNTDEYIASFSDEVQQKLKAIRKTIVKEIPLATEKISYGMPTYHISKNIIHFAAYKNHIGLYPGPDAITAFQNELKGYKTSKGAIQIPINKEIPLDLIKEIVRYGVKSLK